MTSADDTANSREFISQKFTEELFALRIATVLTLLLTRNRGGSKGEYAIKTSRFRTSRVSAELCRTLHRSRELTRLLA